MNSIDKNWVAAHVDNNGEVIIPEGVERIEKSAFQDNHLIKRVIMPDTVIEIGEHAFDNCSNLVDIQFSNNLRSIGQGAFFLCKKLQKIKLPDTLKALEKLTFSMCDSLSSVDLGNGIETIDMGAFSKCISLESITLPDSLKTIDACAFSNCKKLTNVNGGQNLEEIKTATFEKTNIATFNVPSQVQTIYYKTFGDCANLSELYLGENTQRLMPMALSGCTKLKKLSINKQLSYFPKTALEKVDNIEEVEINGTSRIHYDSFKGKSSIRKITIDGTEYLLDENEELFSIQKHDSKVAIIVIDKDKSKKTICIDLKKETISKHDVHIYLANDGSVVRAINSTASITIEQLRQLKQMGEQKVYLYGATRDIKSEENEAGIEYDLYDIDDLIHIKTIIEEIKRGIIIPPKNDKHRQKKIYSQLVRKLSELLEYDFFDAYNDKSNTEAENKALKVTYERITQRKWEDYWEQNKARNREKSRLESGNLLGLIYGRTVCRANVEIIRNLAAEFGIEALAIIGLKHTWNQVKLDGVWYDDDFTNYQSFLARGDLDRACTRFLCGQINGKTEFSKFKMYSKTLNQPQNVGKSYYIKDKKFLLNFGKIQPKAQPQTVQPPKNHSSEEPETSTGWINRIGAVAQEVNKTDSGIKGKKEAAQLIINLDKKQQELQYEGEEIPNN